MSRTITVSSRFAGPPRSANGGYLAGRLAAYVDGTTPVTVTLRTPPPLETDLTVEQTAHGTRLVHGSTLIAEAQPGELTDAAVSSTGSVDLPTARAAEASYAGLRRHPFPGCFVCGPGRETGDGLRLAPGPVSSERTACVWVPDETLADPDRPGVTSLEFAWAALDCPGAWTSDLERRPLVLGRMTALSEQPPRVGRPHVVVGRLIDEAGRKTHTGTTLYDEEGHVLARAEHTWIAIDPADFGA